MPKAGRPRKAIDVDVLRKMVDDGVPFKRIAKFFGVSDDTLVRNFADVVRPAMQKSSGRPQKDVPEKKVRHLIDLGLSAEEIGALLDVSGDTISRHFAEELKTGAHNRNGRLKSELFRRAMRGSDPALIFACKAWCQMYDRPVDTADQGTKALGTFFHELYQLRAQRQSANLDQNPTWMLPQFEDDPATAALDANPPAQLPQPANSAPEPNADPENS